MASAISFATNELWRQAYERLPPALKANLPENHSCRPQDVQTLVTQRIESARARRLVIKIGSGKTFIIRDAFEKVGNLVARFVEVGDIAIQYDPGHAALPWAAVRFILKTAINNIEHHAMLQESIEKTLHLITWAALQERLYSGVLPEVEGPLRELFVDFYEDMLHILAKACRFVGQSRARHAVVSITSSASKYQKRLDALTCKKAAISDLTYQVERYDQVHLGMDVDVCKAHLKNIEKPIQRIEHYNEKTVKMLEDQQRSAILDWTSQIPYQQHYIQGRKKALRGTGTWLFTHPHFLQWKQSSSSEILWLHGMPGSGKSTLLSLILESLISEHESINGPLPRYFYCARTSAEQERSDPEQVLRCLLRQVASPSGQRSVHESLQRRYTQRSTQGSLSMDDCVDLLKHVIDDCSVTYLFVDALDECNKEERQDLIQAFEQLLQETSSLVKIFVTSRDDQDIVLAMNTYPGVCISAMSNLDDITSYVKYALDEKIRTRKLLPTQKISDELKEHIERTLIDKAQGMFRWVELQLQFLCTLTLASSIKTHLGKLPNKLNEAYQRLYDAQTQEMVPEELEIMDKTFALLLVAQESIRSAEFIALVCSTTDSTESLTKETILALCFNLVQYDEHWDELGFVHLSVREFLEKGPGKRASELVATICLAIVENGLYEKNCNLEYAVWHWPEHASLVNDQMNTEFQSKLCSFLHPHAKRFNLWSEYIERYLRDYNNDSMKRFLIGVKKRMIEQVGQRPHALLVACEWGLEASIESILSAQQEPETGSIQEAVLSDALSLAAGHGYGKAVASILEYGSNLGKNPSDGGNALGEAAVQGHLEIARLLLESGANVNLLHNRANVNALQIAALNGHLALIDMLLARGADVNAETEYGNALNVAPCSGRVDVVRTLLEKGANANAWSEYGSALMHASHGGHEQIVRTLIENGAAVNGRCDKGDALIWASIRGHQGIVQTLLENGADVNAQCDDRNALITASNHGHEKIVGILLEAGANVEYMIGEGNALIVASKYGHEEVVQTLLAKGADVNARGGENGNALGAATSERSEKIVFMLLESGADVNFKGGKYGNALATAAHIDAYQLIRLLLEHGAEVNAQGSDKYGNALQTAAYYGCLQSVRTLLEHGADITIQGGFRFRDALQAASYGNNPDVVRLLLEQGADVNNRGGEYSTALQAATQPKYPDTDEEVVRILLENGADINARGGKYETALQGACASYMTGEKIVPILLAAGASVNIEGGMCGSALKAALAHGHYSTVELLRENGAE